MATRLHGIDISNYQRGLKLANTDAQFAIMKATEGTGFTDPYCDGFVNQAKKLGLPWGTYHFYAGGSGRAEADHYLASIGGYVGKGLMVLDFERNTSNRSEPKAFLNRVRDQTGIWPLIYMSGSVVNSGGWDDVAKTCGLWVARWGTSSYGSVGPWKTVALWQYTDRHPTGGMQVDGDYFYGDRAAWTAYTTGGKTPEPTPAPTPEPAPTPDDTTTPTEGEDFDMSTQSDPQRRTKPQTIKPGGEYHELVLEDNGDTSFGFGGGAHQVDARFVISGATASEELMVRVIRFDTDADTDKRIDGTETDYWVQGLPGGGGKSYRNFSWKWHVPNPPKGRGRRLRLAAANFTDHDITIESIQTVSWKAPLT